MSASISDSDDELNPSKLGTKEYWDNAYEQELQNFKEMGDVGEVWFGYDSMERVADWMEASDLMKPESSILDLGTGNGIMLVELHNRGFKDLYGVDYSEKAVELAKGIIKDEDVEAVIETADILQDCPDCTCLQRQYDVCLDKGTYDAICLNPTNPKQCQTLYKTNITSLVKENGLFMITSCNWTQEELEEHFKESFILAKKIPTPTFQFGGKTGSRETSLVFRKMTASP